MKTHTQPACKKLKDLDHNRVQDTEKAYNAGITAYHRGRSPYSCTFSDARMSEAWERGFEAAQKAERR